jgi:recombination associated protein RdgC
MAKEERILPGAVVNAEVDKKVIEIQDKESRKVGRKEKQEIKDEVTMAMLPKAFTRMSKVSLYIAPQDNWMVIDASSANKADEVIALLRKALGTLAIYPPNVKHAPTAMMTSWLKGNDIPSGVGIGESCELKSADEEESTVRCSKQDLMADEVKNHIECGKMVTKLQLNYQDHIDFVLQDDMSVRRIKFADDITKELDDLESDDVAGRFDAEFSIMTLELNPLLTSLLDWFGGEEEQPV